MSLYRDPPSVMVPVETLRRIRETLDRVSSMSALTDHEGKPWWLRMGEAMETLDDLLKTPQETP